MYYSFNKDLKEGLRYENMARNLLEEDFGKLSPCKNDSYDLKNDSVSFEVKTDFISKNTNLVGIEFKNKNRLTGISTTKADYYFIICFDRSWSEIVNGIKENGWWLGIVIETSTLKELCKHPLCKRVWGGDRNKSAMVLVPVELVREYSLTIYPLLHGILT